jgi:hypothetical protein
LIDVDHPPPESELPIASILPDAIPEFTLISNSVNDTNGIDHSKPKQDEDAVYSSPAFVKRARTSYGSMFELDPFAEDDGTVAGKGRKRTRLSSAWTYTSRSPTPEREALPEKESANEPIAALAKPTMADEGCQTVEVDMGDAAEALASFSRQAVNVGRILYQSTNTLVDLGSQYPSSSINHSMPAPMIRTHTPENDSLSVAVQNVPRSPRLQPLSSDELPLVSPLIARGLDFSANRPILSLPLSEGDQNQSKHDSFLADQPLTEVSHEDLYGASPRGSHDGALVTALSSFQAPTLEAKGDVSLEMTAEDHFKAPELYEELDEATSILHSDDKNLADDQRFYVEKGNSGIVYDQNGSPSSASHVPTQVQYPDLDDLSQQNSASLWDNGSSTAAYPEFPVPEMAEYEHVSTTRRPASAPMSRSQSGQSQAQAVDLTESSDDDARSEGEEDAEGEDDEASDDDEAREQNRGRDTPGEAESLTHGDRFIQRQLSRNNALGQSLPLREEDEYEVEGSEEENYEEDENGNIYLRQDVEYDEGSEDEENDSLEIDEDGNYVHPNRFSNGSQSGEDDEESYGSDEGSYDDEDEELDPDGSPHRPAQPSGPPVFIDLLSSDDEEDMPKPPIAKSRSPQLKLSNAEASPSSSEGEEERSDSELITSKVTVSPKEQEERSFDGEEHGSLNEWLEEDSQLSQADTENKDLLHNGMPMASSPLKDFQDQEMELLEAHTKIVVDIETLENDHESEELEVLPETNAPNMPGDNHVEESEREVKKADLTHTDENGENGSLTKAEVNESTLPIVVVEQGRLVRDSISPAKEERIEEEDTKDSIQTQPISVLEVTDPMDLDPNDVQDHAADREQVHKHSPKLVEDSVEEAVTEPAETLEEEFAEIVTEAIEETLDGKAEEPIGETLEEEFAEIVAEAVEEAVEEVMAAQDRSKSESINDDGQSSTRRNDPGQSLGDNIQTSNGPGTIDELHPARTSKGLSQTKHGSPAKEAIEYNAHFTRSKGAAFPPPKKPSPRKSHGLDGAMDDEPMLDLAALSQQAGNVKQLPTPDDTQVSHTMPSVDVSFTSAQDSQTTTIDSQKASAREVPNLESEAPAKTEAAGKISSPRVTRARGRVATADTVAETKFSEALTGEVASTMRTESSKKAASPQQSTATRAESELSSHAAETTYTSPRRSHRRVKSTTSTTEVKDFRSKTTSTTSTKENVQPQTPVRSGEATNSGNSQVPASLPLVVLDQRVSPLGHDASVELALTSLESPSKTHDLRAAPVADLKLKLSRHLRTKLSEFTALKVLRYHLNQKLDVLAIATTTPPEPQRAKGGPRHYQVFFNITDPSIAPSGVIQVQVSRPYKDALPVIQEGDGILLRSFQVKAISKGFALRSDQTEASSWAVFKSGDEVEIRGPPVEYGDEEKDHISQLKHWYGTLDSTALAKINRANVDKGTGSPAGKL